MMFNSIQFYNKNNFNTLQAVEASSEFENSMKAKPFILPSCLYLGKLKKYISRMQKNNHN